MHGGDNPTGASIFCRDKFGYVGNWKCWTHECEKEYGSSIFGLLAGLLKTDFQAVKLWVKKFLDYNEEDISYNVGEQYFTKLINIFKPPDIRKNL